MHAQPDHDGEAVRFAEVRIDGPIHAVPARPERQPIGDSFIRRAFLSKDTGRWHKLTAAAIATMRNAWFSSMVRRRGTDGGHRAPFQGRRIREATGAAFGDAAFTHAGPLQQRCRRLAEQIGSSQERFRVTAIRLIADGACGVVVVDRMTDSNQTVTSVDDWYRLCGVDV